MRLSPPEGQQAAGSTDPERRSRRSFIFFGAMAGAAALAPKSLLAQQGVPHSGSQPRPRKIDPFAAPAVVPPLPEWASLEARLARRVTYGASAADVDHVRRMSYQGYLERQLNYTEIDDSVVEAYVAAQYPLLSQDVNLLVNADGYQVLVQLQESTIYRAAFSERQLYQRMVEFWSDHFNIAITKVGYLKMVDDRWVIRQHALGKFPDLLKASAHSAAMLGYLDQYLSRAGAPNQNYARELMELHTLGVNGGYTQHDVAELSRVLTGWTLEGNGTFVFNPNIHDFGQKTVLGVTIPANSSGETAEAGLAEGELILDVLAKHPSTARFIATKLLKWLLTPEPSPLQISTIAGVYRATGGDIKLMVRAILNDAWMSEAPAKFKRPFHCVASALRTADARIPDVPSLNYELYIVGQPLFYWETPDGYPDAADYWTGSIMPRWAFATMFASQHVGPQPYLAGTPDAAIDLIAATFFAGEMSLSTRSGLLGYLKAGAFNAQRVRETIALAMSSSNFQWY